MNKPSLPSTATWSKPQPGPSNTTVTEPMGQNFPPLIQTGWQNEVFSSSFLSTWEVLQLQFHLLVSVMRRRDNSRCSLVARYYYSRLRTNTRTWLILTSVSMQSRRHAEYLMVTRVVGVWMQHHCCWYCCLDVKVRKGEKFILMYRRFRSFNLYDIEV